MPSDQSRPTRAWTAFAATAATIVTLVACAGLRRDADVRGARVRGAHVRGAIRDLNLEMEPWTAPEAQSRCAWIDDETSEHDDRDLDQDALADKRRTVAADANAFYRGTAFIFWHDFVAGGWADVDVLRLANAHALRDGAPLQRTSTWTWVTGDQHLSNFGVWQARDGKVVLGVNDFDEAVVYDFQIDIWRVAVSIYNHALTNGLGDAKAESAVLTFCMKYVRTARDYVKNQEAQTFEVALETTRKNSKLHKFLQKMSTRDKEHAIKKFTSGPADGRRFQLGEKTDLEAVSDGLRAKIVDAMGRDAYGATIDRVAWNALEWEDDRFEVLDVARRVGAGVGSFGVDRYYVLLGGGTSLEPADDDDDDTLDPVAATALGAHRHHVILDVKEEPASAARHVLTGGDASWYDAYFPNEAMRAVFAQRELTSFTDPYAGWTNIDGKDFVVRERSAYKASFDLEKLKTYQQFAEYVEYIAVATATSHVRGTVGKSPATFKEVIDAIFSHAYQVETWGVSVARVAASYREQVLLDWACYRDMANRTVGL